MITELKLILETLQSVGIINCSIEPIENDESNSLIRGADKNGEIAVYDTIPYRFSDSAIGIYSVNMLLSRVNLFDTEKASFKFEEGTVFNKGITIKQGNRKASYRFMDPSRLSIPTIPQNIEEKEFCGISQESVKLLEKAMAAMARPNSYKESGYIKLISDGDSPLISVKIYDGDDDTYVDEIETLDETTLDHSGSWDIDPFKLCLSRSSKAGNGEAIMQVNENGVIIMDIGAFNVCIPPKIN